MSLSLVTIEERGVKAILQGSNFVQNLQRVITILEPIDKRIVKFQNDSCPISEVIVAECNAERVYPIV